VILDDYSLPATANFQFQFFQVNYVDYAPDLLPGDLVQFELTRINPVAGTELPGDFNLLALILWALP